MGPVSTAAGRLYNMGNEEAERRLLKRANDALPGFFQRALRDNYKTMVFDVRNLPVGAISLFLKTVSQQEASGVSVDQTYDRDLLHTITITNSNGTSGKIIHFSDLYSQLRLCKSPQLPEIL